MAEAIVSIGVQKLWDLLSQQYEQFQGVEDQVTELKRELELLSSFMKDADAKRHTSAVVRKIVEQIKEIIYDAEDTIETFVQKEKLGKAKGIKNRIRRLACIISEHKKNAFEIRGISKRISNVTCEFETYGVKKIIANGGYIVQPLRGRLTFPKDHESDFVGLEANVKTLVEYLVKKDDIQIVSVTGMGGLGKTTLARQVFNHEDVKHQFDGLVWVCVSQEFTRISVWQTILQNLTCKERKDEILRMKEADLHDELFQLLETSKLLIVFDDIWKDEDWDEIKPIFPPKKGCKVLLTSRKEGIALCRDATYINFRQECLTMTDSWTLFQRIALPKKDASKFKHDEEMEEMGKQMIKYCGGLPLAIKVLGGLLATKYSSHDWKKVFEDIGSHIVGRTNLSDRNNSSIYNVLSLSFEELPNYLKNCFLYLAHFPEDYLIDIRGMSFLWAAEGIFEPRHYDGETILDIVASYVEELVGRNIVISERDVTTLRFEYCHLHDMMREICLLKAKEENFLQTVRIRSSTSNSQSLGTSRRFVSHYPTTLHVEKDIKYLKLRSLMVFFHYGVSKEYWMLSGSSFTRLKLLRVLYLYKAKFKRGRLPSGIGKLIHLRYLSLKKAKVSHIHSSLGNLKLLIYLNLNVHADEIFVPNVLMGMQELRYLALPRYMHKKPNLELSNQVNLETLINFSTKHSSIEDLRGMARLTILEITLSRN